WTGRRVKGFRRREGITGRKYEPSQINLARKFPHHHLKRFWAEFLRLRLLSLEWIPGNELFVIHPDLDLPSRPLPCQEAMEDHRKMCLKLLAQPVKSPLRPTSGRLLRREDA